MTEVNFSTTTLASTSPVPPGERSLLSQVMDNRRFLAAAGMLALMIVGWYVLVWWLGFALDKKPVPWPVGVDVDKEFMMTNFPEMFPAIGARYVLLSSKRTWGEHAIPEREAITYLTEETRQEMGVGKPSDAPRRLERASNWYLSRKYGDVRERGVNGVRFWHLDMVYYTGAVDTVAHVPGRCMIAAGATPIGDKILEWDIPPDSPNPLGWDKVRVVRSGFQSVDSQGRQSNVVQYYTFSINGKNEHDWRKVRLTLTANIRQKYVYFGKIQFAPLAANIEDFDAADEAARQFFLSAADAMLSKFPSEDAIEELNRSSASSKSSK